MTIKEWDASSKAQFQQWRAPTGQTPTVVRSGTYYKSIAKDVLVREETPGYHKLVKSGRLLPLSYYRSSQLRGTYSAAYTTSDPNAQSPWESYYTPDAQFFSMDAITFRNQDLFDQCFPNARDYVQASAAKIYSNGWDALTFLGELSETASMFRNIGKSLANLIKKDGIPNGYLQYRYGWRTLYNDLMSLQDVLNNIDDSRKRFRETTRSTVNQRFISTMAWDWSTSSGIITRDDNVEIGVNGTVVADIEPPKFIFNPVKTGWELITASFIIDWFINIGQWIDAMSFLALSETHYGSTGAMVKYTTNFAVTSVSPKSPIIIKAATVNCNMSYRWVVRTPSTIPLGLSTIRRLNVLKVLDIVLIVKQLAGRFYR